MEGRSCAARPLSVTPLEREGIRRGGISDKMHLKIVRNSLYEQPALVSGARLNTVYLHNTLYCSAFNSCAW